MRERLAKTSADDVGGVAEGSTAGGRTLRRHQSSCDIDVTEVELIRVALVELAPSRRHRDPQNAADLPCRQLLGRVVADEISDQCPHRRSGLWCNRRVAHTGMVTHAGDASRTKVSVLTDAHRTFMRMSPDLIRAGMMSPAQVAGQLGVARSTVYELIERGDLPASRVGGQWRTSPQQLDAYLNAHTNTAGDRQVAS